MERNNNTKRFSDRVADYIRYRPHYPAAMCDQLEAWQALTPTTVVADVGAGTGISSIPFLERGNAVIAVEPNAEMRSAALDLQAQYPRLRCVDGTAEETQLDAASVDLIFCAQAFHWFNAELCKVEFQRILRPRGWLVLAWNQRDDRDPVQQDYEALLRAHLPEYIAINSTNVSQTQSPAFIDPNSVLTAALPHVQYFDLEGLQGRLLSASYCPKEGAVFEALMAGLEKLFRKHQQDGQLKFAYNTKVYGSNQASIH